MEALFDRRSVFFRFIHLASGLFYGFVTPPSQKTGKYLFMMAEARERQR